jgi:hypothetical protein
VTWSVAEYLKSPACGEKSSAESRLQNSRATPPASRAGSPSNEKRQVLRQSRSWRGSASSAVCKKALRVTLMPTRPSSHLTRSGASRASSSSRFRTSDNPAPPPGAAPAAAPPPPPLAAGTSTSRAWPGRAVGGKRTSKWWPEGACSPTRCPGAALAGTVMRMRAPLPAAAAGGLSSSGTLSLITPPGGEWGGTATVAVAVAPAGRVGPGGTAMRSFAPAPVPGGAATFTTRSGKPPGGRWGAAAAGAALNSMVDPGRALGGTCTRRVPPNAPGAATVSTCPGCADAGSATRTRSGGGGTARATTVSHAFW